MLVEALMVQMAPTALGLDRVLAVEVALRTEPQQKLETAEMAGRAEAEVAEAVLA